jgi:Fe-S oxidoreductase
VQLIETSCCGLAGSFGYEKEHYSMSMAIAERQLFPTIRSLPTSATIIANGLSCRSQIHHGCEHQPLHLAELLASLLP